HTLPTKTPHFQPKPELPRSATQPFNPKVAGSIPARPNLRKACKRLLSKRGFAGFSRELGVRGQQTEQQANGRRHIKMDLDQSREPEPTLRGNKSVARRSLSPDEAPFRGGYRLG